MRHHLQARTRRSLASTVAVAIVPLFAGCYAENLSIYDLEGRVIIPREAATVTLSVERPVLDGNGDPVIDPNTGLPQTTAIDKEVTDVRVLGPVYVGLYSGLDYSTEVYPHPSRGPAFQLDQQLEGDAYPYGGTTVGDIRFACLEYLSCKVVSGRFVDFDDMVDWFNNVLEDPIKDAAGNTVTNGDYIRQTCYDLLEVTSDQELRLTPTKDVDDSGAIDAGDLDFVENADGDFEASFRIWQADFYQGFTAWAWLDTLNPGAERTFYTTCNPDEGYTETTYASNFDGGLQYTDLLNRPYLYMVDGDYVAGRGFEWNDPYDVAELVLDFQVGADDVEALRLQLESE
ncbi:MAG: hypothetical protein H6733_13330 [Alphaproteobacteria bacterium]|nr:hypothetical protein [Alphaproteobacteria bacterium]